MSPGLPASCTNGGTRGPARRAAARVRKQSVKVSRSQDRRNDERVQLMFRGSLSVAAVLLSSVVFGFSIAVSYVGGSALGQAEQVVHNHGYTRIVSPMVWCLMWWFEVLFIASMALLIALFAVAGILYRKRVRWFMRWNDYSWIVIAWWAILFIAATAAMLIWPLGWRGNTNAKGMRWPTEVCTRAGGNRDGGRAEGGSQQRDADRPVPPCRPGGLCRG